ncbi:unnamed protein product [Anisakis simplex]|uniref:Pepsin inhibitor-3-like repeated domain-containing protein n=1 Tax=Anisakis simplex TaxID=6269 RepID=A0A158PP82_ANISI|nr:unnamed protein product [Anisakis simplex]
MLLYAIALLFLASNVNAGLFSDVTEIKNGNTTCVIENGELTIDGVKKGNLTEAQKEELKKYNEDMDTFTNSWLTKMIESIKSAFASVFGSMWHGSEDEKKAEKPDGPVTAKPKGPVGPHFPKPLSFCHA